MTSPDGRGSHHVTGFTNGCFDLLHEGHRYFLARCRANCDRLIVALDSDFVVRALKGEGRPVWSQNRRYAELMATGLPDHIVVFTGQMSLYSLIKGHRPDILFKGGDWAGQKVVGSEFAGRVMFIDRMPGFSTTELISHGRIS